MNNFPDCNIAFKKFNFPTLLTSSALDVLITVSPLPDTMSYLLTWALNDTSYAGAMPSLKFTAKTTVTTVPTSVSSFELPWNVAWSEFEPTITVSTELIFPSLTYAASSVTIDLLRCSETRSIDLCDTVGCVLCPLMECRDSEPECAIMPPPVVRVDPSARSAIVMWSPLVDVTYTIFNSSGALIANVTDAKFTLSGLEPFTEYTVFVDTSKGSFSGERATVVFTTLSEPSDPPTALLATLVEHNSITLSWTASSSPEVIEYWVHSTTRDYYFSSVTSGTSVTIDAVPDSSFNIKVFSYNGQLFSTSAACERGTLFFFFNRLYFIMIRMYMYVYIYPLTSIFGNLFFVVLRKLTILAIDVMTPDERIPQPYIAVALAVTDTSAECHFINPEDHVIFINLTFSESGACASCPVTPFAESPVQLSSLSPMTTYHFSYWFCSTPSFCSQPSEPTVFTTLQSPPTAPLGATLDLATDNLVVMSWNASINADYYTVGLIASDSSYAEFFHTPETTATFRNIDSNIELTFSVSASNAVGSSSVSTLEVSTRYPSPSIVSIAVSDPDNLDRKLSIGDVITTVFDVPTNAPSNFILECSTDISAITMESVWTANTVNVLTVSSVPLDQSEPLLGLTTCRPVSSCDVLREDLNSPRSSSEMVITGTWGEQPTELNIAVPSSVVTDEDTTYVLTPTVTSDSPIADKALTELTVSCTGDCLVSAAGMPFTTSITIIDTFATVTGLLDFGISVQPLLHSTSPFRSEISLSAAGLSATALTTVEVSPMPNSFDVTFPVAMPKITATGGVFLSDLVITDVDESSSYNLVAQIKGAAGTLILDPSQCPTGVVMVSQIIAIASGSLSHLKCVAAKLKVQPNDAAIANGVLIVDLSLIDLNAQAAGLSGSQVSSEIAISVSCIGLPGGTLASATLDSDMTIALAFDRSVSSDFVFAAVDEVLSPATAALMGSGSYVLAHDGGFRVYPGLGATFMVSSPITILENVFYTCPGESFASGTVALIPPASVVVPNVSIMGPSALPVCNSGIELWASAGGMGGRPAVFSFTVDDPIAFTKLETSSDGSVKLASDALLPGAKYTFTASVTNLFGKTAMVSHSVTIGSYNVPQVTVSPESGAFKPSDDTTLTATVAASDCLPEDMRRMTFLWTSNKANTLSGDVNSHAAVLNVAVLAVGETVDVTLEVRMAAMTHLVTTVTLTYERDAVEPVAEIAGGSQRSPRQSAAITMDASGSKAFDGSLEYKWSCLSLLTMMPCTDRLNAALVLPDIPVFDIPAASLSLGAFAFTVTVTDSINDLTASDAQLVIPKQGDIPEITLSQTASIISVNDEIGFLADVVSEYPPSRLAFQWTSSDIELPDATSVRSPLLMLTSSSFVAGQEITVNCRVTDPVGLFADAQTSFKINSAPYAGTIHTSVDTVAAVTGLVTLTTFNWEDREGGPLSYQWMIADPISPTLLSSVSSKQQVTVSVPNPASGESTITVAVVVRDSLGASAIATKTLSVTVPVEGLDEAAALGALEVAKKNLVDTGSPDLTVSLISTVIDSDLEESRRLPGTLVSELTATLSSIADASDATTTIDLATKLAAKISSFDADTQELITILQNSLATLRSSDVAAIDRNVALASALKMAISSIDKPSARRSTSSEAESAVAVLRAILDDVTVNTFQLNGQTFNQTSEGRTIFAIRADASSGLSDKAISESVSVSAAADGVTFDASFDLHTMVFPTRISDKGLNFAPLVAFSPLAVGSVDIAARTTSATAFAAASQVTFAAVDYFVPDCEHCLPTCVLLTASGMLAGRRGVFVFCWDEVRKCRFVL